jgi:hypothetical protein
MSYLSSDATLKTQEDAGQYVSGGQLDKPAFINRNGNFDDPVGERYTVTKTPSSGPAANLADLKCTFVIKRLGNLVTLQIPGLTYTGSTNTGNNIIYAGLIPAKDRPRVDKYYPVCLFNSGADIRGTLIILSVSGNVYFVLDSPTTWGIAGLTVGFRPTDITWDCKL